jgi:hypothetical protein
MADEQSSCPCARNIEGCIDRIVFITKYGQCEGDCELEQKSGN